MRAGFDVVGVDIDPRHREVYPGHFVCGDAANPPARIEDFDFVWASPPCQRWSVGTFQQGHRKRLAHPDFLPQVRRLIAGHPFSAIENVPKAPLRKDLVLSGPDFGLNRIQRNRIFELSFFVLHSGPKRLRPADRPDGYTLTVTKSMGCSGHYYKRKAMGLPGRPSPREAAEAMGMTWRGQSHAQIGDAVPPAYSHFIGSRALAMM